MDINNFPSTLIEPTKYSELNGMRWNTSWAVCKLFAVRFQFPFICQRRMLNACVYSIQNIITSLKNLYVFYQPKSPKFNHKYFHVNRNLWLPIRHCKQQHGSVAVMKIQCNFIMIIIIYENVYQNTISSNEKTHEWWARSFDDFMDVLPT